MRKCLIVLLAAFSVVAFALPAMADVSFFGYARIIPTYYNNFDFDDNAPDASIATEAGGATGEAIRSELRLGWKAGGDKWKISMIAESDLIYNNPSVDRASGTNGEFFGIERAEFTYAFAPALELITGWPISAADIGTGGVLYGDDHPIIGFRGKITDNFKYQALYIPIFNTPVAGKSTVAGDWRVYLLKPEFTLGLANANMTLSPILMYSDNRAANAKVMYYGLEGIGKFGFIKPSFEVIAADGEFRGANANDIKAYAAFAGVELGLSKAFNPYIAVRYTSGDDDSTDKDVEGFVGITDIGRFTPLMGMDGNILGETMSAGTYYDSFLYSYAPDRAGTGNEYGGFGNASSGNNPGSMILAVGAKGAINEQFSYKAQVFGIWFDKTENLLVGAGKTVSKVDDFAGVTTDIMLKYDFSKNFSASYIFSAFFPGDGIKDQQPSTADDTFASLHTVNLIWTY